MGDNIVLHIRGRDSVTSRKFRGSTSSLTHDGKGMLWVGGRDQGVAKLSTVRTIRFEIGAPSEFDLAHGLPYAASDSNGHIWTFAERGLKEYWRDTYGRWQQFTKISCHKGNKTLIPWFLYISQARIWVATVSTNKGATQYRLEYYTITPDPDRGHSHLTAEQMTSANSLPSYPLSFIVTEDDTIWESIAKTGIVCWDPKRKSGGMRIFG